MLKIPLSLFITIILIGCATPHVENLKGYAPSVPKSSDLTLIDKRIVAEMDSKEVDTYMGVGTRIDEKRITPVPMDSLQSHMTEVFESKGIDLKKLPPLNIEALDISIVKGRAPPVQAPPGTTEMYGVLGAAIGMALLQTVENARAPDSLIVSIKISHQGKTLDCSGGVTIKYRTPEEAYQNAMEGASTSCAMQVIDISMLVSK